jgi:hypothetical protein
VRTRTTEATRVKLASQVRWLPVAVDVDQGRLNSAPGTGAIRPSGKRSSRVPKKNGAGDSVQIVCPRTCSQRGSGRGRRLLDPVAVLLLLAAMWTRHVVTLTSRTRKMRVQERVSRAPNGCCASDRSVQRLVIHCEASDGGNSSVWLRRGVPQMAGVERRWFRQQGIRRQTGQPQLFPEGIAVCSLSIISVANRHL